MNALNKSFGFTATCGIASLSFCEGRHFRMYATGRNRDFGEGLSKRQIDLLRIGTAVHVADCWAKRQRANNGHRCVEIEVEVLDDAYWRQDETYALLKECVDFVSGGDDWTFRFARSKCQCHDRRLDLFRGVDVSALVALYSGGLDSAAGLATRLHEVKGRMVVPVTLRHQMQKGKLVRDHFGFLVEKGLIAREDLKPFQAGAFIRNKRIKNETGERLREVTHRCRPILFMSMAGLVADTLSTAEVEIFESGIGALNLPLVNGPADFRTTRSTHPHYLRLISKLVSHVNESETRFVLPFVDRTKADLVKRAKALGVAELARKSVSCIVHPLRRKNKQCGACPACIYRRQAMITAGVSEKRGTYMVDLFSPNYQPTDRERQTIRSFQQQTGRLAELEKGSVPEFFRKYLYATRAVARDEDIAPFVEVYRRYRCEWAAIIANARDSGLPWIAAARSLAIAQGARS